MYFIFIAACRQRFRSSYRGRRTGWPHNPV